MSFFDRFRAKWKHPDPKVRLTAIPEVDDDSVLESLVDNDPDEAVRQAAVAAIKDQSRLARIASGMSPVALSAVGRLEDRRLLAKVAQAAESGAVREQAVERIDDGVTLHRISTSDTNARVRLKARSRRDGPDPVRDFIRTELSRLQTAAELVTTEGTFTGTLEEVTARLIGDLRFRINGWLDHDVPGVATVVALQDADRPASAATGVAPAAPCRARFLAFKRAETGETEEAFTANAYFEITVWRTDESRFTTAVEERNLKLTADAVVWSRVSNASRQDAREISSAAPLRAEP